MWDNVKPDFVAGVVIAQICAVGDIAQFILAAIQLNVAPQTINKRAYHPRTLWRNTAKSLQSAASRYIQQNCFGVIGRGVRGRSNTCGIFICQTFEKIIPNLPPTLFNSKFCFCRLGCYINAQNVNRNAHFRTQLSHKSFIALGFLAPQIMVYVCRPYADIQSIRVAPKKMK